MKKVITSTAFFVITVSLLAFAFLYSLFGWEGVAFGVLASSLRWFISDAVEDGIRAARD